MASRIAAHAGDIVKQVPGAIDKDIAMAKCRKELDWEGQFNLAIDPEKARLVELRYFAGLTGEQAARILGISPTTADRHWAYARACLRREIQG